jgi:hypothetical protein
MILDQAARALVLAQSQADCFDDLEPEAQEEARQHVRAVLRAVRTPSEAMLDAGAYDDFGPPGEGVSFGGSRLEGSWSRMIDAALTSPR